MDKFEKRALVVDFIHRSFRDVADRDYICARACYRLKFSQQFLWSALQAVEKYLKAILLYNDRSAKGLGHNIEAAYRRLDEIEDIDFDIPAVVEEFLRYLNREGANRYFEFPYVTTGDELLLLDRTVWHLRRYCQPFDRELIEINGRKIDSFAMQMKATHHARYKDKPNKFEIASGFLEKVLADKHSPARLELVWRNFWYGTYTRTKLRNVTLHSGSAHPTHVLHPEIFPELDKRVSFSRPVRDYFFKKLHKRVP